ncbi:MAG: hypothetical protein QW835_00685 [Candidatus Hadarchaeum sp.]
MIGFDIDGVLADSFFLVREMAKTDFGVDLLNHLNGYHISVPGLSTVQVKLYYRTILQFYYKRISPYPDAIDLMRQFKNRKVNLITSRQPSLRKETERWLRENLKINNYQLFFSERKIEEVLTLGLKFFVEDRLATANDLAGVLELVFLPNRPWNIGRETAKNVVRIDSLLEIKNYVDI